MAYYSPLTFLNPIEAGKAAGRALPAISRGAIDAAAEGIATATAPVAGGLARVAEAGEGVSENIGKTIRDTTTKVILYETVVVVGVLGVLGIAAWFFSRSPEARAGAKLLAVKAATRGMG